MATRPRSKAALVAVLTATASVGGMLSHSTARAAVPLAKVSYTAPPAALTLTPFARVTPPAGSAGLIQVAVAADGATVVLDADATGDTSVAFYAANDGTVSAPVPLAVPLYGVTPGPDHVIYGVAADSATYAAIPMGGARLGQVIASAPIADMGPYLELGPAPFGNTREGVVDLTADVGAVLLGHVDQAGNPLSDSSLPGAVLRQSATSIIDVGAPDAWDIDIERVPDYVPGYSGETPPARSASDANVWATFLGASPDPGVADPTLPVIAVMRSGARTEWYSVGDGWKYSSSDVWGTIFTRLAVDGAIELARLPETTLTGEPTADGDAPVCPDYVDHTERTFPIRTCDSGLFVLAIQGLLVYDHGADIAVDGYYGSATEAAVREFQTANGLTADGLTGPRTWAALIAPYAGDPFRTDADRSGLVDPWEFGDPHSAAREGSERTTEGTVTSYCRRGPCRRSGTSGSS